MAELGYDQAWSDFLTTALCILLVKDHLTPTYVFDFQPSNRHSRGRILDDIKIKPTLAEILYKERVAS